MPRELRVAADVAAMLPASHIAQLGEDVAGEDNVCVACGALIEGPAAELVVLHDDRAVLARLAHPECVASGAYEWEGTTSAVQGLALRPEGLDVATALVWRREPAPRAIVLIEPRIHVSLDAADADPLARLFAEPLGLSPAGGALSALAPPPAAGCRLLTVAGGLELRSGSLRVSIPADATTLERWRAHIDDGHAIVIAGRGLGITRPEGELARSLAEALALRPCWAATVAVSPLPSRP